MKVQSPSTPSVEHDESNLLVEFLMLNKYRVLEEYPWRKGNPLAQEWGQVCKVVRRLLKTLKIDPQRLGWYIRRHKVTELDYSEFGLVKWKIDKWFPFGNLEKTADTYRTELEKARADLADDLQLSGVTYTVKEDGPSSTRKKTLLDVIKELEMAQTEVDFVVKSLTRAFTPSKSDTSDVEFFDAQELQTPKPNYTGSLRLDINLGVPFPRGRIIEVYGNPGSAKTTLSLSIAAKVVERGGKVLFIDQEKRLAPSLVATFSSLVENTDLFKIAKAVNGDKALQLAEQWCRQFEDALVIIDSVDALIPERVEGREIGETDVGSLPKLMSDGCRKLKDACDASGSTVIFLNQVRSKINAYGDPDTTSGGRALGFYASQRIKLWDVNKSVQLKSTDGNNVIGHTVRFEVIKNSYSTPYVKAEFPLIYGKGVDNAQEIFDLAVMLGLLEQDKKMFIIDGKKRHPKQVVDIIRSDPEFKESLFSQIKEAYPNVWPVEEE